MKTFQDCLLIVHFTGNQTELQFIFGRISEWTSLTERRQNLHVYFSLFDKEHSTFFEYTQKNRHLTGSNDV